MDRKCLFVRVLEVKELGDLSPHWDGLRHDVISHCDHLIGCYQETLAELHKLSSKVQEEPCKSPDPELFLTCPPSSQTVLQLLH